MMRPHRVADLFFNKGDLLMIASVRWLDIQVTILT